MNTRVLGDSSRARKISFTTKLDKTHRKRGKLIVSFLLHYLLTLKVGSATAMGRVCALAGSLVAQKYWHSDNFYAETLSHLRGLTLLSFFPV